MNSLSLERSASVADESILTDGASRTFDARGETTSEECEQWLRGCTEKALFLAADRNKTASVQIIERVIVVNATVSLCFRFLIYFWSVRCDGLKRGTLPMLGFIA
jgi:hypothetical protein